VWLNRHSYRLDDTIPSKYRNFDKPAFLFDVQENLSQSAQSGPGDRPREPGTAGKYVNKLFYLIFLRLMPLKNVFNKEVLYFTCCAEGGWPKQGKDPALSAWISQGTSGKNSEQQST
jgi:hypothetical protein